MSKLDHSKKNMTLKSRKNLDSKIFDAPIDPDEELGLLVAQIEQNTFSILSMKQKFGLVQKNGSDFRSEASSKLDSFGNIINQLENRTIGTFDSYSSRLDKMEVLSFRPSMFHPSKSILINDAHEISSLFYTTDFIYIGTDTSFIFVYNSDTLQKISEIGPLDSNPISNINVVRFDTHYVIASTSSHVAYVHDPNKPNFQLKLNSRDFFCWPSDLSSKYKFGIIKEKMICLYSSNFQEYDTINDEASIVAGGLDMMVAIIGHDAKITRFGDNDNSSNTISFFATISHLTVSRTFFCVSVEESIIISGFDGTKRSISLNGPTNHLLSNEFYIFRISTEMLVEVYDAAGKNPVAYIGSKDWSPHEGHDEPSAVCFEDSTFMTARVSKCVIWS